MKLEEIGVGIDVARYEHVAQFLGPDKKPIRKPLRIKESHRGYQRFERALRQLHKQFGGPLFRVVMEEANVYGRNLRFFLQRLSHTSNLNIDVVSHNPLSAKRYKQAFLQDNKNDLVDSYSEARFAVVERPEPSAPLNPVTETLRAMSSHLNSLSKDITRQSNQLRAVLSMVFPELLGPKARVKFTLVSLLEKYPTAHDLATADLDELAAFQPKPGCKRLGQARARQLKELAQKSIGCLQNEGAGLIVRSLCASLKAAFENRKQLEKRLVEFYKEHHPNELTTIPGVGPYTAAVLTGVIGDPHRFETDKDLAGYLGLYPVDDESGQRKGRKVMSKKGNDLARHALYMAAVSAVRSNPAVRAMYARQRGRGKSPMCTLGHCMRKLATIALAILKSGKPFDPNHYPWEQHNKGHRETAQADTQSEPKQHDTQSQSAQDQTRSQAGRGKTQAQLKQGNIESQPKQDETRSQTAQDDTQTQPAAVAQLGEAERTADDAAVQDCFSKHRCANTAEPIEGPNAALHTSKPHGAGAQHSPPKT